MKNKFKITIFIFIIYIFQINLFAQEEFVFESKSIELEKSQNKLLAKDGVTVTTNNGLLINAKESEYDKNLKILDLIDSVKIVDQTQKIQIESEKVTYEKEIEKIFSDNFTKILIDDSHIIDGKNITFLRNDLIIFSDEITLIKDKHGNILKVNGFNYFLENKILKTKKLTFLDSQSNEYKSNNAFIDLNNNEIAAKDIQIYFAEGEMGKDARLKGSSMISKDDVTTISNGIFTTCKIRDDCPPWTFQSKEIKHDKKTQTINYKNSLLKLYDVPVFYFPKFFHPDPTVKRQSGFLIPSLINSSVNGSSIQIPYYKVISENKDLTITPRIFFNNNILLQGEYRQVEKNTEHSTDLSFKKLDNSSKSHFFSNTSHNFESSFFDYSNLEINLEKTTNDTYLKSDNIISETRKSGNPSLLNSFIKFNSNNETLKLSFDIQAYEDLSVEKKSDKFQYVFPNFSLSKIIDTNLDGSLTYKLSGSSQQRNTNETKKSFTNDLDYKSKSYISKYGFVSTYDVLLKNTTNGGKNTPNDKTETENYSSIILTSTLPLKKEKSNFINNLIPKISFRYNPSSNKEMSDLDRKIDITNIFSNNRLGVGSSIEGGQSVTLGFDYKLQNKEDKDLLDFSLAQIFRDRNSKRLPTKSKMQSKSSDIVGKIDLYASDNFKIKYDFSADNNLKTLNYNKVEGEFIVNNFITSFDFLEENNEIGSDSYLTNDVKLNLNDKNSLAFSTRRNRKIDLTEFYNLIYEYKNDCLVAAIEYNKNYYQDRELKPGEEIFFKLTITSFSSINSPNMK